MELICAVLRGTMVDSLMVDSWIGDMRVIFRESDVDFLYFCYASSCVVSVRMDFHIYSYIRGGFSKIRYASEEMQNSDSIC